MAFLTLKDETETRLLIAETGNSLRGFSDIIDISPAYLSQILSGKRKPSPTIGHKIAKGLGLEIKEIFLIKLSVTNEQTSGKELVQLSKNMIEPY